jgi:hypothetical protein
VREALAVAAYGLVGAGVGLVALGLVDIAIVIWRAYRGPE